MPGSNIISKSDQALANVPAGTILVSTGQGQANIPVAATPGVNYYLPANNLSDVVNVPAARTNLGLGTAAVKPVATADQAKFDAATINCYGDSLTNGGSSGSSAGTYPAQLAVLANRYTNNQGVSGQTSAEILARVVAAPADEKASRPWIFCAGRNDLEGVATTPQVLANVASMVAELGSNTKYVVMGVINGEGEGSDATGVGLANYNQVLAINAGLAAAYGPHFFDARGALLAYPPQNSQDVADIAVGIPPTSLRSGLDILHLNATGYGVWANGLWPAYADILTGLDPVLIASNLPAVMQSIFALLGIPSPVAGGVLAADFAGTGRVTQIPLTFNGNTFIAPGAEFALSPASGLALHLGPVAVVGADIINGEGYFGYNAWMNTLGGAVSRDSGPALLIRLGFQGLLVQGLGSSGGPGTPLPVLFTIALDGSMRLSALADSAVSTTGTLFLGSDHLDTNGDPKLCRKGASVVTVIG